MGQNPEHKPRPSYRGLRAIFAAGMVDSGGAKSTGKNASTVDEIRSIVFQQLQTHGGLRFEMPGDAISGLFESAVNAVRCALETQRLLAMRAKTGDMHLRIGIHLGEVLFEDGTPRGEALLIAAGLEVLADPGGILVSGAVMDVVSARISATFEERGAPPLKDIPRRIVTFAVTPPPQRTGADDNRAGLSALDHTTQFDLDTLRALHAQQAAEIGGLPDLKSNKALILNEQHLGSAGTAAKASPPPQPQPAKPAVAAPTVARRSEDAEKRVGQEAPRQPGKAAAQSASAAYAPSAPATKSAVSTKPAAQGVPAECVASLAAALALHLGPLAKVLISRHAPNASSAEQLVSLLEREIRNNEERFQFRLRASHICKEYSYRQPDEA